MKRRVLGIIVVAARIVGWLLIALAILSIPAIRSLTGSFATSLGLLSSIVLGLAGVACLVGVELFLRFFDQFLSRY
jgi:hypothetical protein